MSIKRINELLEGSKSLLKKIEGNIDELKKYGIKELRDGLTLDRIKKRYSWILKAKIKDAVLGKFGNLIVWYDGEWKDGIWENGIWKDGIWENGVWYNGKWIDGIWRGGVWYNGLWYDGRWYNGYWYGGRWYDGYWYGGYDEDGNYHPKNPNKWKKVSR